MSEINTKELHPEVWTLFDKYVHGLIDRRGFLDGTAKYAVGGMTSVGILEALKHQAADLLGAACRNDEQGGGRTNERMGAHHTCHVSLVGRAAQGRKFRSRLAVSGDLRAVTPGQHRKIWDADVEAFKDHWEAAVRVDDDFVREATHVDATVIDRDECHWFTAERTKPFAHCSGRADSLRWSAVR